MRFLLGSLIIITGFSACQKNSITSPNPAIPDSIRLQKIIFIDTTLSAPADTLSTASFIYDNSGRVTTVNEIFKARPGGIPGYIISKYYYSGTGTLPVKRTSKSLNGNLPQIHQIYDTTWFNYDALKRKIFDSTRLWFYTNEIPDLPYPVSIRKHNSRYKMDTIITNRSDSGNIVIQVVVADTSLLNAEGLVIRDLLQNRNNVTSGGIRIISYDYSYANKVNPLSRLNIYYSFNSSPSAANALVTERLLLSQNKIIVEQKQVDKNGNNTILATANCKYNNLDLLTSITYFYNGFPGFSKYLFVYNN
jgi:hypothetical protein